MKTKLLLLVFAFVLIHNNGMKAQCASGTVRMNYYHVTSGAGTYADPGLGDIEYGFCLTLNGFFERQTNWAHGIFVAWNDIPLGVQISQGLTGEQTSQHGSRVWTWIDSLRARQLNLPGVGYYVDDGDRNPRNNYGDNGSGTPNATFPGLSPFCFVANYTCGAPTLFRPWVTVTGDGTTGAWKNPSCSGDVIKSSSGGPLNDGILVVCGLVLPLDLISFDGYNKNGVNYIQWKGIADNEFSHYELEKRNNNSTAFYNVQNFNAPIVASEHQEHSIQYMDSQIDNSINYYRLKMVEKNNTFVYSKIIAIVNASKNSFQNAEVFPNPADETVNIGFPDAKALTAYTIEILDISGKSIQTSTVNVKGSNQLHLLDVEKLGTGVYFLKLNKENEAGKMYKFVKK